MYTPAGPCAPGAGHSVHTSTLLTAAGMQAWGCRAPKPRQPAHAGTRHPPTHPPPPAPMQYIRARAHARENPPLSQLCGRWRLHSVGCGKVWVRVCGCGGWVRLRVRVRVWRAGGRTQHGTHLPLVVQRSQREGQGRELAVHLHNQGTGRLYLQAVRLLHRAAEHRGAELSVAGLGGGGCRGEGRRRKNRPTVEGVAPRRGRGGAFAEGTPG